MRLTTIILIISLMQVSASGLAQKVSLSVKKSPLIEVLDKISNQTGYDFLFTTTLLKNAKLVTIHVQNKPLNEVLNQIFEAQSLAFTIGDKSVVIKSVPHLLLSIRGTVIDELHQPLVGATIKIKGTNMITTTNENGIFQISEVKISDILVISFLGYNSKEVVINSGTEMTIMMESITSQLSTVDIVNTGYQSLPKERSAGAFAKPDMKVFNNRTGTMNVLQRLDGLVPGLTINNSPAASSNPLLIRGISSINGARGPLIVIDGMAQDEGAINSVNPNDVEDITVLKDATASSIWGSRASNGVIVIVTKKGKPGQHLEINYDGFLNFQGKPDRDYYNQLSSEQFISAAKSVFNATLYPYGSVSNPFFFDPIQMLPPHETILYNQSNGLISADQANAQLTKLAATNNSNQIDELWQRNASLMNHTLSARGGSDVYGFYSSLAYTKTNDDIPGNKNNSFKFNLRQDLKINKSVKVYLITDITNALTSGKNNFDPGSNFLPYVMFKDDNNNPLNLGWLKFADSLRTTYETLSGVNLDYVPIDEFNYAKRKSNTFLTRLTSGINIKIIDGLSFEGLYGLVKGSRKSTYNQDSRNYTSRQDLASFTVAGASPGESPTHYLPTTGSTYTQTQSDTQNYTIRNQFVYSKNWNEDKHQLTVLAGQEIQDQLANVFSATSYGYNEHLLTSELLNVKTLVLDGIYNPVIPKGFGASFLQPLTSESEIEQRFLSYYANASYTYDHKYTLNGSWRIDRSNLFGTDHSAQQKPVFSIGGGWLISSEQFMKQQSWIQRLSLRGTYGITGNSPIPGTASSYDIFLDGGSFGPFSSGNSLVLSTPANPKLTWESTKTYNIGIDFAVLNRRLSGAIDLYKKSTDNLIGELAVNSLTGYNTITGNFGNMTNKGIELSLTSINAQKRNFSWISSVTMSHNKNEITKLNRSTPITDGATKVTQNYLTGYPAFAVFAYQYAGLDQVGDPQIKLLDGSITKERNVSKPEDIKYMGTYQPVWNGGLSNTLSYKDFSLNVNMVYSLGNVMRRDANTFFTNRLVSNVNQEFANRWQSAGDETKTNVPSYVAEQGLSLSRRDVQYYTLADINVVSASYIKIRDINLSYSLPKTIASALKASTISFRAQLSNVMLWKANNYGIDPEFQQAAGIADGTGLITGVRSLPINQHTVTIGAHVIF